MFYKDGNSYYNEQRYLERQILNANKAHNAKKVKRLIKKDESLFKPEFYTELLIENLQNGGNLPIVKFLINKGADIKDSKVFLWSFVHGNIPIIEYLIKQKMPLDGQKESSILISLTHERFDTAKYLLKNFSLEQLQVNKKDIIKILLTKNTLKVLNDFFEKLDVEKDYLQENNLLDIDELKKQKIYLNVDTVGFLTSLSEKDNFNTSNSNGFKRQKL